MGTLNLHSRKAFYKGVNEAQPHVILMCELPTVPANPLVEARTSWMSLNLKFSDRRRRRIVKLIGRIDLEVRLRPIGIFK